VTLLKAPRPLFDQLERVQHRLMAPAVDSNACFARATFSRIWPADLVQMNGLGSALWFSRYSMMGF
jgi:hypothetical protein